ncbi:hypothetical protein N7540_012015 [Penicillium herquei]|nr:hypothetical protein N7540_012015 [Penicillium herquei]
MTTVLEEDPAAALLSSEDEQDEEEEVQIESLVQGRAKRSTAGRNMAALIDAAADDDLTLLFEEVEDDNEFAIEEAAEDEDLGLESSSDDDDDQGPNAQNDYEGEQQLQKDERKKRRAQNDLRFQTLRKRVKIDPTAVSAIPAPPRPKKKSERISWLPTPEDGPTRSSSRRQTMVNKEMTHARLKDSQEKRVRIIATMKEAEKRKAHLKPKEMTQEDHLAEAERIERTNSKSLNRWEQAERRKAEERRARIEALQNRRLDGPVMSYWSGLATWVNGRLTRVGKVEIKPKPEKEVAKKKKTEKDEKPVEVQGTPSAQLPHIDASATPAPNLIPTPADGSAPPADASTAAPILPTDALAQSENASTSAAAIPTAPLPTTIPPGAAPVSDSQSPKGTTTQDLPAPGSIATIAPSEQPTQSEKTLPENIALEQRAISSTSTAHEQKEKETSTAEGKQEQMQQPVGTPPRRSSQGYPLPIVEIVNRRDSMKGEDSENLPPTENADPMEIDKKPEVESTTKTDELTTMNANPPNKSTEAPTAPGDSAPTDSTNVPVSLPEPLASQSTTSANTTLNLETPQAPSTTAVPLPTAPGEIKAIEDQPPTPHPEVPNQVPADAETPSVPEGPQVIEYTGRNLTILENFDDRTAHSKKYKISSSLCVITSLPSRYRDPETSLPYANSYAYGQIRRLESQDYTWSGMLGCFVGPAETAAKGVPARFLGGEKSAEEKEEEAKEKAKAEAEAKERAKEQAKAKENPKEPLVTENTEPAKDATPAAVTETVTPKTEPMEVDG